MKKHFWCILLKAKIFKPVISTCCLVLSEFGYLVKCLGTVTKNISGRGEEGWLFGKEQSDMLEQKGSNKKVVMLLLFCEPADHTRQLWTIPCLILGYFLTVWALYNRPQPSFFYPFISCSFGVFPFFSSHLLKVMPHTSAFLLFISLGFILCQLKKNCYSFYRPNILITCFSVIWINDTNYVRENFFVVFFFQ